MQLIYTVLINGFLYLLISLSFSLIFYPTKFFHLAHAAVIAGGAYLYYLFSVVLGWPVWLAVILAIAGAAIPGLLCEILLYRAMRRENAVPLSYFIVSLGAYVVLQNVISLFFGEDTKVIATGGAMVGHRIWGAYLSTVQLIGILVSFSLCVGVQVALKYTIIGKSMRAVADNPELCSIYGIDSNKIILIAFSIGSALGAAGGILSALDTNMTPSFGFDLLLYGIVVMIIGGVGSVTGLVASAFFVAAVQSIVGYYIDTKWMEAATYCILILFLVWKPFGFSGNHLRKTEI